MTDDYYLCPKCGNEVKVGTPHCPKCTRPKKPRKKSPSKSWQQDEHLDGLNLPDEDFDYEKFIASEFGGSPPHKEVGIAWYWWLTGILLLIGILSYALQ